MSKLTKNILKSESEFSMHPYPVEYLDGGEVLVEFLIKNEYF